MYGNREFPNLDTMDSAQKSSMNESYIALSNNKQRSVVYKHFEHINTHKHTLCLMQSG